MCLAFARVSVAGLVVLVTGCATRQKPRPAPTFYPPPPAAPRLQYLTSYSSPEDFEPPRSAFLTFLLGTPPPRRPLVKPYGMAISDGEILACDTVAGTIHILDLVEKKWRYFMPTGQGRLTKAINIDVDDEGNRYVADIGRGKVLIYDSEGVYLGSIGDAPGMRPCGVLVAGNRLYVSDLQNHNVVVYHKSSRQKLFTIPSASADKLEKLFSPTNLALDSRYMLYVSDTGAFRVQQYDATGKFVRSFGRHGDAPGEFARNKGVAVDREGRLFVVDAAAEVVQVFDSKGQLLMFFGDPLSTELPLVLPATVLIDYDHNEFFREYAAPDFELEYLVLVAGQYGTRKISVYGFGHGK